jgi:SNF2 family DNA or RNA helicase
VFFDKQHNILIYDTPLRDAVAHAIPDAKLLHNGYVAFPRTLLNCKIARWLAYYHNQPDELPVPPVMDDYDWPIISGRKPLAHQILTSNFMVLNQKSFNLSDMGTMKTLSTLWAADYLMLKNPGWKTLIVCPRTITQRVWGDEIFANLGHRRKFEILEGTPDKRIKLLNNKFADFYIINYDGLKIGAHRNKRRRWEFEKLSGAVMARDDIRIVVLDEADAYKAGNTDRSRVTRLLIGKRDYLWLLTGTPTPQGPFNAHGLALFVNNAGGETFYSFYRRTMVQLSQYKWVPARDGYEEARKLLQPSIRIDIDQVWDGPECTTQQRQIDLTPEQRKLLSNLKNRLLVETKDGAAIIPANEAASRTKALQIILGAIYDANHVPHETNADPRIAETFDVIEHSKGKVLIFIGLTSVITLVYKKLKEAGVSCATVTGATTDKARREIFEAFQGQPEPRVILADPGTMAHGLNLYAATTVLWYGTTDKTGLYLQGNARAHRPGQKYPVTVVQFVSTSLERSIFSRLEKNESLQGTLLNWIRGGTL